jgi:membrane protease YdiL (CAAX protease family)
MEPVPNFPALNGRNALGYWFGAFLLGNIASLMAVLLVWRPENTDDPVPIGATAASALGLWTVFFLFLLLLSRGIGSRSMRHDYGLAFTGRDVLVGLPLGVFSQFVLVNIVNWPLSRIFPDSFSPEAVEQRARELTESATGAWVIVLVAVVVFGAPFIEELVYRGLVQQGLANSLGATRAWLIAAVLFAAIHLEPIEFPGLLAFALVLGWCYRRTSRLGLCMVTHMAFNASGLLVVSLIN